jgi:hypothetical protein
MMLLRTSSEFILVPFDGPGDPTIWPASMAIVAQGAAEPADAAYQAATWINGEIAYKPGAGTLTDGMYDVYVRVLAGSEDIRKGPGRLRVGDARV